MTMQQHIQTPQSVLSYIMHRPPMVLLDDLVDYADDEVWASLTIRSDLMFCEQQGLPTWAGIEIMAQTVSLYAGVQGYLQGQPPKIGYLLGTRKLQLPISHFALGSQLKIHAKKQYIHENLGVFDCAIYLQNQSDIEIKATLSVYEP